MIIQKTLLIGGSGNLGLTIKKSKIFKNLHSPSRKQLDLLNVSQIKKILYKNKYNLIINCASIARMKQCETNISHVIKNNIEGTLNLVNVIS